MTPTTSPAAAPILVALPAGAARIAGDYLVTVAAKDDESGQLVEAGHALHRAGWNTGNDAAFQKAHEVLKRDEWLDAEGSAVYLPDDLVTVLLEARGWVIEPIKGGGNAYVMPGRKLRAQGGKFGEDFLWDRDDAMRYALTAEGFALGMKA